MFIFAKTKKKPLVIMSENIKIGYTKRIGEAKWQRTGSSDADWKDQRSVAGRPGHIRQSRSACSLAKTGDVVWQTPGCEADEAGGAGGAAAKETIPQNDPRCASVLCI